MTVFFDATSHIRLPCHQGERPLSRLRQDRTRLNLLHLAVGARDDFQQMPVGILEIDAAPAPVAIDLAGLRSRRIGPKGKPARLDAPERGVEFPLAHEKS